MQGKIVDNLIVRTGTAEFSRPVALGRDNSAVMEVWLINDNGSLTTDGVTVAFQGSNDGINWTVLGTSVATTGTSSPAFATCDRNALIPYSQVRLKFGCTGGSAVALLDAALRTYTRNT